MIKLNKKSNDRIKEITRSDLDIAIAEFKSNPGAVNWGRLLKAMKYYQNIRCNGYLDPDTPNMDYKEYVRETDKDYSNRED